MGDALRRESSSRGCSDRRNLLRLVEGKRAPEAANGRTKEDGEQAEEGDNGSEEEDEKGGRRGSCWNRLELSALVKKSEY